MNYKLLHGINPNYTTIEQILTNRGISIEDITHYLNTTDADINEPERLGEENLRAAAACLIKTISEDKNALIIIDCDCDGYTSSAVLINYLYELFPAWAENHLNWFMHQDKTHGLSDAMAYIALHDFSLVICPDSSSNDYDYHKELADRQIQVIVLDHHEADHISENAIIINNQLSDYPNKELSGVGVTWQFCRYLDKLLNKNLADNYIDLVALGNCGDMMSLKSIETKHLINKGFKEENLKNPFIYGMAQKNSFSLGSHITPMGAAFYIVPFVNAMVRSGTLDEMQLLFNSMLKHKAFEVIPSTKRGHRPGEMEKVVDQALRVATNVKNRQTRAQDSGMIMLEEKIENENMMSHKVLLFLLNPGQIDTNIAGLVANKLMAKYQRPVCVLTKCAEAGQSNFYRGSARGYEKSGIESFRQICIDTGVIEFAEGHANAFGLGIAKESIKDFIEKTDIALKDMESEPLYRVDYIYKGVDVDGKNILDIASLNDLWGQGIDESYICVENLKVSSEMIKLMGLEKNKPTLKITLPNKVAMIKFGSSEDEYNKLLSEGYMEMNIIGRCEVNEWNGWVTPQMMIEDYEIIGQSKYNF